MQSITLENLTIGYTSKKNRKTVASGINASLDSGHMTCLIGPNGVGKSTLLRTLSAFQPPLEGKVYIHGKDLATLKEKKLAKMVGVVLTAKPDVQNMTVEEMVGLGRSPYTGFWGTLSANDLRIVEEAIALVGIASLKGRYIHTLSDGERQKVMIAKALAQQTPVIYLDEPTAFLDFPSKVEVMQLLHRLAVEQQKTVFLSTHDVELSLQIADCLWLMESEQLSVGTPRQLAEEGALTRFIQRDGITFDAQTLTIHVKAHD